MRFLFPFVALLITSCTVTEARYEGGGSSVYLKRTQIWGEDVDFSVATERATADLKKSSNTLTPEQQEAIFSALFGR